MRLSPRRSVSFVSTWTWAPTPRRLTTRSGSGRPGPPGPAATPRPPGTLASASSPPATDGSDVTWRNTSSSVRRPARRSPRATP